MAYTPELNYQSSCTLRRIAWALDIPMTKALHQIINVLPIIINKAKVCDGCRDKSKCTDCSFHQNNNCSGDSLIKILQERRNIQCPK